MIRCLAKSATKIIPAMTFCMKPLQNSLYLTFDDGPHPESTPRILELLSRHEARATFFCLGRNAEKYPQLLDSIITAGHAVGNHTFSHPNGWLTSTAKYIADIEKAAESISSTLFRPPYGRITPSQYLHIRKKFKIIMWTRQFADYSPRFNPLKSNLNHLRAGDVVVMHDRPDTIIRTLPLLEKSLNEKKGLTYKVIPF
jgi:peptidoglycan-N-acetylglucosamine deacetylase